MRDDFWQPMRWMYRAISFLSTFWWLLAILAVVAGALSSYEKVVLVIAIPLGILGLVGFIDYRRSASDPTVELRRLQETGIELRNEITGYVPNIVGARWAGTDQQGWGEKWWESPRVRITSLLRDIRRCVDKDLPSYSTRLAPIVEPGASMFGTQGRSEVSKRLEDELAIVA